MSNSAFIEKIAAYVQKYAPLYGICVHSPIIAQAILESGSGTTELAQNANNFFGLKWRENRCPSASGHYFKVGSEQNPDGSYVSSEMKWFKFPDMEASVKGYFDFTNIPNYAALKGVTDPRTYLEAIKAAGYATSLKYVDNLMNVIERYDLTKYDSTTTEKKGKFKVCIDAGHYEKYNRSPGIAAYYESEVMWKLHLLQKKHLEALGIEVVTTRSNQKKDLALKTRGKKAEGCELFISNHSNAVGSYMKEDVDYVAVYHLTDDTTTTADERSKEIAAILAPLIADIMGTKQKCKVLTRKSSNDRNGDGIMNDNYYGVLHGARLVNVPGLILEHSFHTNSRSVNWLLNEDNLNRLAKAEAEAIARYLRGTGGAETGEKTEDDKNIDAVVFTPYLARIIDDFANVRNGAGSSYKINVTVKKGEAFTIVEVKDGWGKLKSGAGWLKLSQTEKVETKASKEETKPEATTKLPYMVRITASILNVRAGAGMQYKINRTVAKDEAFTIVEVKDGWGKLKSGAGWINLSYTEKC